MPESSPGSFLGGCLFVLVGLCCGGPTIGVPIARIAGSAGWVERECRIERHEVVSHVDSDGDQMYATELRYSWVDADGVPHYGTRADFGVEVSTNWRSDFDRDVRRWPAGSTAPCWSDPSDPDALVLDRSAGRLLGWASCCSVAPLLVGLLVLGSGAHGVWWAARRPSAEDEVES